VKGLIKSAFAENEKGCPEATLSKTLLPE